MISKGNDERRERQEAHLLAAIKLFRTFVHKKKAQPEKKAVQKLLRFKFNQQPNRYTQRSDQILPQLGHPKHAETFFPSTPSQDP